MRSASGPTRKKVFEDAYKQLKRKIQKCRKNKSKLEAELQVCKDTNERLRRGQRRISQAQSLRNWRDQQQHQYQQQQQQYPEGGGKRHKKSKRKKRKKKRRKQRETRRKKGGATTEEEISHDSPTHLETISYDTEHCIQEDNYCPYIMIRLEGGNEFVDIPYPFIEDELYTGDYLKVLTHKNQVQSGLTDRSLDEIFGDIKMEQLPEIVDNETWKEILDVYHIDEALSYNNLKEFIEQKQASIGVDVVGSLGNGVTFDILSNGHYIPLNLLTDIRKGNGDPTGWTTTIKDFITTTTPLFIKNSVYYQPTSPNFYLGWVEKTNQAIQSLDLPYYRKTLLRPSVEDAGGQRVMVDGSFPFPLRSRIVVRFGTNITNGTPSVFDDQEEQVVTPSDAASFHSADTPVTQGSFQGSSGSSVSSDSSSSASSVSSDSSSSGSSVSSDSSSSASSVSSDSSSSVSSVPRGGRKKHKSRKRSRKKRRHKRKTQQRRTSKRKK